MEAYGDRPKRRFINGVKEDMKLDGVREEDEEDRWRQMILLWRLLRGTTRKKRSKKKTLVQHLEIPVREKKWR